MSNVRVLLLADEVLRAFAGTAPGHCARVDYLERAEALAVRDEIAAQSAAKAGTGLVVRVLGRGEEAGDERYITTDGAIEIRNRKAQRLCLFVPIDVVDAAVSSLANSFAPLDGRALHAAALARLVGQLSVRGKDAARAVFSWLRRPLRASDDQRLDFAAALLALDEAGDLDAAGRELWRVGLIADGGADFARRLERNRRVVLDLSRPDRLLASTGERIQKSGVDAATAADLAKFFRGRSLHDVRAWSTALAEGQGPTFDAWEFPQEDPSDLRRVTVRRFFNAAGEVEKYTKLSQPGGAGSSLVARCGPKGSLVVRWVSDPPTPHNLGGWRVEIVPAGKEIAEADVDLPARDVPAGRRTVTLKLDLDLQEQPDFAVVVRVTALDPGGNEVVDPDTQEPLRDLSDEFFLGIEGDETLETVARESRRTVPTVVFGRLEVAQETRDGAIVEAQPEWASKEQEYFSLRLNDRRVVNIGLSAPLLDLERRVLEKPRDGGCFVLEVDEIRAAESADCEPCRLDGADGAGWADFWRARDGFFTRVKRGQRRDVIEAADWTAELAETALRYARAYRELLDRLIAAGDGEAVRGALSIDTLLVRVDTGGGEPEEALVLLPTHPLRAAWFAGYTQLLRGWEAPLLEREPKERRKVLDLAALRELVPTNVPAFAFHAATDGPFLFFQNLRFFHGVALPPTVPDPYRRYGDIATVLGVDAERGAMGDLQPERLAEHLARFRELHPYARDAAVTLVNPDRGDFFAEALLHLLRRESEARGEEGRDGERAPTFTVASYVEDPRNSSLRALDRVRQQLHETWGGDGVDPFLPRLAVGLHPLAEIGRGLEDAHLAVVADLARPAIAAVPAGEGGAERGSGALYGLITRFTPQLIAAGDEVRWRYGVAGEAAGRPEPHPAGQRYGDVLVDLHQALLRAGGLLVGGQQGRVPTLEVAMAVERRELLEQLHNRTNWVITLDRFFPLDYFDSPYDARLADAAGTYLLDYSPEFSEGLGHRIIVTTAWREEIGGLLARAMDELGFAAIEQSVGRLLHYLKMVSGRLALQALESPNTAAAAVGLGVVTAWLQARGRLRQAILVPVDLHPRLFSQQGYGRLAAGEQRCDLVLIALKRNIVEATFIEVKWRRGRASLEELAYDMTLQMEGSARALNERFFEAGRIDGALQRAHLANVLRFYFDRARRYGVFEREAEQSFLEHLTRLEKTGLQFRPSYEGYIVSLEQEQRRPFPVGSATIAVLTAADFARETEFTATVASIEDESGEGTAEGAEVAATGDPDGEETGDDERVRDALGAVGDSAGTQEEAGQGAVPTEGSDRAQGETPAGQASALGIPLGEALDGEVRWTPSTQGSPHLFVIGIPGQGKSWTVIRLLRELAQQGCPSLVLDFHGQFGEAGNPFMEAVRPSVLDAGSGLPFSPFECRRDAPSNEVRANAFAIAEIFAYVAGLGDMQRDVVYSAIERSYAARGFGQAEGGEGTLPTMAEVLARIEELERERRTANVAARCRPLLEMELFRPGEAPLDLREWIRGGMVIDLHNLYLEAVQQAAGAFVLRKLYRDMFQWGTTDRLRLAIVLDEAHRLAKDVTLPKIMKEGRKFGIAVIVASQGMGDFHPDVLATAGTKVLFRVNFPESRKLAGFIRARQGQDLAARMEQLSVGTAFVQTPEMAFGSQVRMYPLE